jgi:hypothetical protein
MSSPDGVQWDRTCLEAWVRPGLDAKNWTERSNMPAWRIAGLQPGECSLYISEHYRWPDNRLRRLVLPRHRLRRCTRAPSLANLLLVPSGLADSN